MNQKVALVTGGARGIGLATAKALHADGWRIALADRDAAALATAVDAVGPDTLPVVLDVADIAAVRSAVDDVIRRAGRLDGLVNNAGVFRNEPLLDTDEETYDHIMTVNLKGAFFLLQAAARAMLDAGNGGVIVNMASAAGRSGRPTQAVYGMTKAALIHLTKSAAIAFAPQIRVASVCPAAIETDMWTDVIAQRRATGGDADVAAFMAGIPLGRSGMPEEVAAIISFFFSDRAAFMTGNTFDVSGGREM
jgi:NAD(P)-dependent dehydrogenase (short-subunit alcohol dehydrogenase family)